MSPLDPARAAELQVLLEGVPLPASKDELVAYARSQDPSGADGLAPLPDRVYFRLDEVGEALASTQPARPVVKRPPRAASGEPPGGADYVKPRPDPGGVRSNDG